MGKSLKQLSRKSIQNNDINGYSKTLKQRKTIHFRICNQKVQSSILGVGTIKNGLTGRWKTICVAAAVLKTRVF
jgi:hypothetical protein